ncbi:MAG: hypothetical protein NTY83_02715, partial [Candidatus Micrarchaeota archaeon]|nr:hypothetical protein [Candidatus Micrarchaeota archaeon]
MKLKAGELAKITAPRIITPEEARRTKPEPERRARFPRLSALTIALLASISAMKERNARADEPTNPPAATQPADAQPAPAAPAQGSTPECERTPEGECREPSPLILPGDVLFRANFLDFQPMGISGSTYEDRTTAPSLLVDIAGQERTVRLDNDFSLGGSILGNPVGTAVFASAAYRDLIRIRGGNIWFYDMPTPFGTLLVTPQVDLWRFKLKYLGTLTGMYNMPSYLYSSHSAALGFAYPFQLDSSDESRRLWLRFGAVGGGSLAYPKWDDIYFNLTTGLSLQLAGYPRNGFDYLLYAMATFYAASEFPMGTLYIGNYDLFFQRTEFGFQARIFDNYTLLAFAGIGTINNQYGIRGTWTWNVSDTVQADLWASGGITQWSNPFDGAFSFNGKIDPLVMLGARVVYGGENLNSENTSSYTHDQDASVNSANMEDRGNYLGDASWNRAKARILTSDSFEDFASSYSGENPDEIIRTAHFLAAFLGDEAYAIDAMEAAFNLRIFDPEVQRVANADLDNIFLWMQAYVNWRAGHGDAPLPEDLQRGIAVCAGIHWFVAEFLHANGVESLAISINSRGGPHVVTAYMGTDGMVHINDYGDDHRGRTFAEAIHGYGIAKGAITENVQIYLPGYGYVGTYTTPEGDLLHQVVGIDNERVLREFILG